MTSSHNMMDRFLDLPPELRFTIYRIIIDPGFAVVVGRSRNDKLKEIVWDTPHVASHSSNLQWKEGDEEKEWRKMVSSALLVNKSFHRDFADFFFSHTMFIFLDVHQASKFICSIDQVSMSRIRAVSFGHIMRNTHDGTQQRLQNTFAFNDRDFIYFCDRVHALLVNITTLRLHIHIETRPDEDFVYPSYEVRQPFPVFSTRRMNNRILVRAVKRLCGMKQLEHAEVQITTQKCNRAKYELDRANEPGRRPRFHKDSKEWQEKFYWAFQDALAAIIEGVDLEVAWTGYVSLCAAYEGLNLLS